MELLDLLIFEFDDFFEIGGWNWVLGKIWFEFEGIDLNGFDFEWFLELRDWFELVFDGKILLSEDVDLWFEFLGLFFDTEC